MRHDTDECLPYNEAPNEPATEVLGRLLRRHVVQCHCGSLSDEDRMKAAELVWRMAAHGYVVVDIDHLEYLSQQSDHDDAD